MVPSPKIYCIYPQTELADYDCKHFSVGRNPMARIRGTKNKRTLLREAELEAIRAGTKKDVLTSIYVIMEYFFFRAKGMRAVGNHDKAERYYLRALTAAEKIAPYKYARLSAVKVMGDPNAQKDFEDGATLVRSANGLLETPTHHFTILCSIGFGGLLPMTGRQS
jgi:hypothetical protein